MCEPTPCYLPVIYARNIRDRTITMKYNPDKHHRRSIRLKGYDYSQPGFYFITICTWQRECLFGEIKNAQMHLNRLGEVIQYNWHLLAQKFSNIRLDTFIIMPNHIHGILHISQQLKIDLPEIIRSFKTTSARRINQLRATQGIPVWQRNYYEHIIRNHETLTKIRQYITDNPQSWERDQLHPSNPSKW